MCLGSISMFSIHYARDIAYNYGLTEYSKCQYARINFLSTFSSPFPFIQFSPQQTECTSLQTQQFVQVLQHIHASVLYWYTLVLRNFPLEHILKKRKSKFQKDEIEEGDQDPQEKVIETCGVETLPMLRAMCLNNSFPV